MFQLELAHTHPVPKVFTVNNYVFFLKKRKRQRQKNKLDFGFLLRKQQPRHLKSRLDLTFLDVVFLSDL